MNNRVIQKNKNNQVWRAYYKTSYYDIYLNGVLVDTIGIGFLNDANLYLIDVNRCKKEEKQIFVDINRDNQIRIVARKPKVTAELINHRLYFSFTGEFDETSKTILIHKGEGDILPPLKEVGASRSRILMNPVSTS